MTEPVDPQLVRYALVMMEFITTQHGVARADLDPDIIADQMLAGAAGEAPVELHVDIWDRSRAAAVVALQEACP